MISIRKPKTGYELKLELLISTIAWELFTPNLDDPDSEFLISEEDLAIALRVSESVFNVLSDFKEE